MGNGRKDGNDRGEFITRRGRRGIVLFSRRVSDGAISNFVIPLVAELYDYANVVGKERLNAERRFADECLILISRIRANFNAAYKCLTVLKNVRIRARLFIIPERSNDNCGLSAVACLRNLSCIVTTCVYLNRLS